MMKKANNKKLLMAALLSATATANTAAATDPRDLLPDCETLGPNQSEEFCKCYGSALKGQNDCSNKAGTHSCGGASKVDCDPGEYKVVKACDCPAEKTLCQTEKGKPRGFWKRLFGG